MMRIVCLEWVEDWLGIYFAFKKINRILVMFKRNYTLFIICGLLVTLIIYSYYSTMIKFENMENAIIKAEINGLLINVKNVNKGNYYIEIKDSKTKIVYPCDLPLASFVSENNIQLNDSISKEAKNDSLTFYRKVENKYQPCCIYEIND